MNDLHVKPYVSVIIAALNEEEAIANVVASVPRDIADESSSITAVPIRQRKLQQPRGLAW
jgi:hypothetical protein